MTIRFRQVGPGFAAEVEGLDLTHLYLWPAAVLLLGTGVFLCWTDRVASHDAH